MATKRYTKAAKVTKAQDRDERDALRTRRIEARRDMVNSLPAVLAASSKVIDSVVAGHRAHVDGCGDRYAEVVLEEHKSGVTFLNRLLTLAEETGMVTAVAGAVKAACAAAEAESREEQRRAECIKYEDVVCRPWTRMELAPEPEPDPEPEPEPAPEPAPEPEPEPAKRRKRKRRRRKTKNQTATGYYDLCAEDPELAAAQAKCEALESRLATFEVLYAEAREELAKLKS